ncbi:hypothetical protein P4L29_22700 [Bacillus cereus]|nr:hypothetical protein [Bacillus cereus]
MIEYAIHEVISEKRMRKLTYEMTSQGLRPIVQRATLVEMEIGAPNDLKRITRRIPTHQWEDIKKRGYIKVA